MVYAVDIGNTNIVVGVVTNSGVQFTERISTNTGRTDLEYYVLFESVLRLHGIDPKLIKGAIISSVVPPVTSVVSEAVRKLIGVKPLTVGPGIRTGLNIKIDDPAQLGADLAVAAVASSAEYPLPQIIIDMGTATTITVIDKKGALRGVIICPGVRVGMESLVSNTAQLPEISFDAPSKVIGTNSIDSLKSGAVYGNASMLDGMIDRIEEEINDKATVVATGGLAYTVMTHCRHDIIFDDALLLKGLYIIFNKNC